MGLQYGINFTESEAANYLEQNSRDQSGVRSWRKLFGNASLSHKAQSETLGTQFSNAAYEAYENNLARENLILKSGLSGNATKKLLSDNRQDLVTAYDTYVSNYINTQNTLNENYKDQIGVYNDALNESASNTVSILNSAYDYLSKELFGANKTLEGTPTNGATAKIEGKGNDTKISYDNVTVDALAERGLAWVLNTDGSLMSWDKLKDEMIDDNGQLTREGEQFFDAIYNGNTIGYKTTDGNDLRSFENWLSDTNSDLYNWYAGQDAFNYSRAGTNRGNINILTGRESDDYQYHNLNYLAEDDKVTLTELDLDEYNEIMAKYDKKYNRRNKKGKGDEKKTVIKQAGKAYGEFVKQIPKINTTLSSFEKLVGSTAATNFYETNENYQALANKIKEYTENAGSLTGQQKKALAGEIQTYYTSTYNDMNAYIEKNRWQPGKSGY